MHRFRFNRLQHTATLCSTLQHTAAYIIHINRLTARLVLKDVVQCSPIYVCCNTLQCAAVCCSVLQSSIDVDESYHARECVTLYTREWAMVHSWINHVTSVYESCRLHECVMSLIWICHGTLMNELSRMCDWIISGIWVRHVARMNESCHTYEWVVSHVWISPVARMKESCHTYEWVMSRI